MIWKARDETPPGRRTKRVPTHTADESRREADEPAEDRIREASALTESLLERARAVVERSDELISALDEAGRRLASGDVPAEEGDPGVSEGARLLATQMAVAGSTREEIGLRLREEFGIEDPSQILDEIGL